MNALWWWIDRWRKSTAYTDMTLAQQGAYRNLLDEATLRGGAIPNDERILAKASGDATAWRRLRGVVLARFVLQDNGWHNTTLDDVIRQSERRAKKQQDYRDRPGNAAGNEPGNAAGNEHGNEHGNATGNEHGNATGNEPGNAAGSPDPDPDLSTPPSQNDGGDAPARVRVLSAPITPRGHAVAFDMQQQRQHALCAPQWCTRLGTAPRRCMSAGVLSHLASCVSWLSGDAAIAYVLTWARGDTPPVGWVGPAKDFAYWTERWEASRPKAPEREDQRAHAHLAMVAKLQRGEYDQ